MKIDIPFSIGDSVKVEAAELSGPRYGWGDISPKDVGVIDQVRVTKDYLGKDRVEVYIDFPNHRGWLGDPADLVESPPPMESERNSNEGV